MTPTRVSGPEQAAGLHPTIVIGYGSYGLRVMQSLLSSAAARGVLSWAESPEIATVNERRLLALALFWIPDMDAEAEVAAGAEPAEHFEMMQDLFEQIERVEDQSGDAGRVLAERVEEAKQRLFSEPVLTKAKTHIGVGLDVIVLAQPTEARVLGKLRQILGPVMKRLAGDPGLTSPQAGQDLLNLLQILDFEHFWDSSQKQTLVRDTLAQNLEASDKADDGRPAFGRTYLFDGRTERGNQDEAFRRQQAVLFLEFLIFDGHRSFVDLRTLYQRENRGVPSICAIGARGIEHSTALLRRLAAASFARGWLEYLAGNGTRKRKATFAAILEPFSAAELHRGTARKAVEKVIDEACGAIEKALLALDPAQEDWPAQVESECERLVKEWMDRVHATARLAARGVTSGRLTMLHSELVAAASAALGDPDSPATLGMLLEEIDATVQKLSRLSEDQPAATEETEAFPGSLIGQVQANYLATREGQVEPGMLRNQWWPLAGIAAAVALLPLAQEAAEGIMAGAVPAWAELATLSVSLAGFFWLIGTYVFHPRIAGRVERALSFHTDPERGRIADAIRRLVASSSVGGRLRAAAGEALGGQSQRMIGEAIGELLRLRVSLAERKREIEWLNQQLHDYLNLHGVDAGGSKVRFVTDRRQNPVLRSLESEADLQAIAALHPRIDSEYRDLQRTLQIFTGWDQRYLITFLDPHRFLDRLMTKFPVPEWKEEGEFTERYAQDVTVALSNTGEFPASFYWLKSDGLPHQQAYCSLPEHWTRLRGLDPELAGLGYRERIVKRPAGERMYLLQTRMAVPARLLRRSS